MVMLMLLDVVSALLRLWCGTSLRPYVFHKGVRSNATHGGPSSATAVKSVNHSRWTFIHKIGWLLNSGGFFFSLEMLNNSIFLWRLLFKFFSYS